MIDKELLGEFIVEAREHMDYIERDLVKLEKDPEDIELIKNIFGSVHSIKGSSGYIGLNNIYSLTHAMENVLDHLKKSKFSINETIYDRLFEGLDKLKSLIEHIEKTGETDQDASDVVDRINSILKSNKTTKQKKKQEIEQPPQKEEIPIEETEPIQPEVVNDDAEDNLKHSEDLLANLDEFLDTSEEVFNTLKKKVEKFISSKAKKSKVYKEINPVFIDLLQIAEYQGFDKIWKRLLPIAEVSEKWEENPPTKDDVNEWFQQIQTVLNKSEVIKEIKSAESKSESEGKSEKTEYDFSEPTEHDFTEVFGDYDRNLIHIFIESLKTNLKRIKEIKTDLQNPDSRKIYLETLQWIYQSANYMDVDWIKKIAFKQLEILNSCTERDTGVNKEQAATLDDGYNALNQLIVAWEKSNADKKEDEFEPESHEIYNFMDEDKELIAIFIDNYEGHLNQLHKILTDSQNKSFKKKYFDVLLETISLMESASNYMNYEELHQYCFDALNHWEDLKHAKDFKFKEEQNHLISFIHQVSEYLIKLFPDEKDKWKPFLDIPLSKDAQRDKKEEKQVQEEDVFELNEIFNDETLSEIVTEEANSNQDIIETKDTEVEPLEERETDTAWEVEETADIKEEPVSTAKDEVADNIKKDIKHPTLRVAINKVENLMAIIGELVVNRSAFSQLTSEFRNLTKTLNKQFAMDKRYERLYKSIFMKLDANTANLGRITNQIQEGIMGIRMVPIENLFKRFPRMIREIAKEARKEVELEIIGEDTELDKTVIEKIADPIVHILRNAIDHGIEDAKTRKNAKKPEVGKITINAFHESGKINIVISDDGQGIDEKLIAKSAIEKKLVDKSQIKYLTKEEKLDFLFTSGFSTSDKVSNLSGRGVGLDVVKRNIEKLNGTVQVQSEIGIGTSVVIQIPLTLAIIQALLVKVQSNDFCIPLTSVTETLKIGYQDIDTIEGHSVYYYRDQVISLVYLNEVFGFSENNLESQNAFLVVVNSGNRKIGIVVDELIAQQDIVIKPLEEEIIANEGITGAAILGGGEIALIIDVPSLINFVMDKEKRIRKHFPKMDLDVAE